MTLATPRVRKIFSGSTSGLSLGACVPHLKFVSLDMFELLAFNAHNLRGHVTLATPPLRKNFSGVMTRLSL